MQDFDRLRARLSADRDEVEALVGRIRDHEITDPAHPVFAPHYATGWFMSNDWIRGAVPQTFVRTYGSAVEQAEAIDSFIAEATDMALSALDVAEEAFEDARALLNRQLEQSVADIIAGEGDPARLMQQAHEAGQFDKFSKSIAEGGLFSLAYAEGLKSARAAFEPQQQKPLSMLFPTSREHMFSCMGANQLAGEIARAPGILQALLRICDAAANEDTRLEAAVQEQ